MLGEMAPDLASHVVETILNGPLLQRWFDSIEARRPRGIVALVRRLRGKDRGLTPEQRQQLEQLLRNRADKYL